MIKYPKEFDELHIIAQPVFKTFYERITALGYDIIVTSAYRTFWEQYQLHMKNSRNAAPGFSYHNYGLAIDMNIFGNGIILKKASNAGAWKAIGIPKIAKELGLRWGGEFSTYYDPIHFDYPIKKTDELHDLAAKQFGANVEIIHGNKLILQP